MRYIFNKIILGFSLLCFLTTQVDAFPGFVGAASSNGNAVIPRNIASGVRVPGWAGGALSNGTDTSSNCLTLHYNESGQTVYDIALVYSGWYMQNSGGNDSEGVLSNSYTETAAVQYPVGGTRLQETWSSATSVSVTPGSNIIADYIHISTGIPPGGQFAVRSYSSVSAGGKWPLSGQLDTIHGEAGNTGTPSDQTISGTISGGAPCNRPSGILAIVPGGKRIVLAGMGDSIMCGQGDGGFDSHGNTGAYGRAASGNVPFIPMCVTGQTQADQIGHLTNRLNLLQVDGITTVINEYGVNDAGSHSVLQMETNATSFNTSINNLGIKVYQTTLTPQSNDTVDRYCTVANQTPGSNNTANNTFSTWVAGTPSPLTGYIDIRTAASSSFSSGLWKAGNSQTAYLRANTDSWTASGTPTTTSIASNSSAATDYYAGGVVLFTSGVNNGLARQVSSQTGGGTFTVSAFASAPSAGDTFLAIPLGACSTSNDSTHPQYINGFGGVSVMSNYMVPIFQSWLQ